MHVYVYYQGNGPRITDKSMDIYMYMYTGYLIFKIQVALIVKYLVQEMEVSREF